MHIMNCNIIKHWYINKNSLKSKCNHEVEDYKFCNTIFAGKNKPQSYSGQIMTEKLL